MQLDHVSRHCVIMGAFGFTLCVLLILIGIPSLRSAYRGFYGNSTYYVKYYILMILANGVGASVAILAINGIKERNASQMVPGLMAVICVAIYFLYDSTMRIGSLTVARALNNLFYPTCVLGFSSIILYPLITVYLKFRNEMS